VTAAALRIPLASLPCPECAGGGEINGVECRGCGGRKRLSARARRDWRALLRKPALAAATAAGTAVGTAAGLSRALPGLGGAAGLSVALGAIAGHVFGHGLTPWVALAAGSVFALALDRRL
jgi:hypothetical protein